MDETLIIVFPSFTTHISLFYRFFLASRENILHFSNKKQAERSFCVPDICVSLLTNFHLLLLRDWNKFVHDCWIFSFQISISLGNVIFLQFQGSLVIHTLDEGASSAPSLEW